MFGFIGQHFNHTVLDTNHLEKIWWFASYYM